MKCIATLEIEKPKHLDIKGNFLDPGRRIGYCNCLLHPGNLSVGLYKEHRCEEKQCSYFYKFEKHPYWTQVERVREKSKAKRQRKKDIKDNEKQILDVARTVRPTNENFAFTRVEYRNNCYYVYYVAIKKKHSIISGETAKQIRYIVKGVYCPIRYIQINANKEDKRKIIERVINGEL